MALADLDRCPLRRSGVALVGPGDRQGEAQAGNRREQRERTAPRPAIGEASCEQDAYGGKGGEHHPGVDAPVDEGGEGEHADQPEREQQRSRVAMAMEVESGQGEELDGADPSEYDL